MYSNGFRKKLFSQNPFKSNKLTHFLGYTTYNSLRLYGERCFYTTIINNPAELTGQHIPNCSGINERKSARMQTSISDWWITGFTDTEGCFRISVLKNKELKTQWGVRLSFQISLHAKDKAILNLIQYKLGIGKIYTAGPTAVALEIRSIKEL